MRCAPQDVGGTVRYTLVNQGEAVLGLNLNELRIAVDAGHRFAAMPRLSVSGRYSYAFTEFQSEEQFVQFDRLIRDNNFHLGATFARTFRHFDVFASYLDYTSGTDTTGTSSLSA
jgi:hypothetical protein